MVVVAAGDPLWRYTAQGRLPLHRKPTNTWSEGRGRMRWKTRREQHLATFLRCASTVFCCAWCGAAKVTRAGKLTTKSFPGFMFWWVLDVFDNGSQMDAHLLSREDRGSGVSMLRV
jgi:hypothetical protein